MRFLEIILVMGGALLVFAPITGYIASSHGRSFWRWFGLGLLLPFFSVFVALFVAMRAQLAAEKAAHLQLPAPEKPAPPPAQ